MKNSVRNIMIGAVVGTVVAGGIFLLCKGEKSLDAKFPSKTQKELSSPELKKIITYEDGSIDYIFDISEEPYREQRSDIASIEYVGENYTLVKRQGK